MELISFELTYSRMACFGMEGSELRETGFESAMLGNKQSMLEMS